MINSFYLLPFLTFLVNSIPFESNSKLLVPPVPVVIWHGLGDKSDNLGLLNLKTDLESRFAGIFVHLIQIGVDGPSDQRSTFFGNANEHVALACEQLLALPEIMSKELNPSGKFDALGFSQGGQFLRAVVERCGGESGLTVRNLVTTGSQHMGISALPPCPPDSSPFSTCRLLHLSVVRNGLYSSFAQHNLVPAQYVRDEARIEDYLSINTFLKDINNERKGDLEVGPPEEEDPEELSIKRMKRGRNEGDEEEEPAKNSTYKANLAALTHFVMFRFSEDATVVPPQSAHFTLPSPYATNCPSPALPGCYADPVPYSYLPLFAADYVGLKLLDQRDAMKLDVCEGAHMQIDEACWGKIVSWFGKGDGIVRESEMEEERKFIIQL